MNKYVLIAGKVMHIIQTKKPIEGKLAKLVNGVTVAQDGSVYWTTSSCDVHFDDAGLIMFGDASGRYMKYIQREFNEYL